MILIITDMKFIYAVLVICCLVGPTAAAAQGDPPPNGRVRGCYIGNRSRF